VRRAGRPGDRSVRPGRSAVRGARANGAAVALDTDPDDGSGDRRLADQPRGGRRARASRTGRAPPAACRCWVHLARCAAGHRARALPAQIRRAVRLRIRLPDLPGPDAAARSRGPRRGIAARPPPIRPGTGYRREDQGKSTTIATPISSLTTREKAERP